MTHGPWIGGSRWHLKLLTSQSIQIFAGMFWPPSVGQGDFECRWWRPQTRFQTLRWHNEPSGGGRCPIHVARESQQHLDGKSTKALKLLAHLFSRCEGSNYTRAHRTTLWVVLRKSTIVGSVCGHIFLLWVWLWICAGLLISTHHSHSSQQVTIIDQDFNLSRPGMCGLSLFFAQL